MTDREKDIKGKLVELLKEANRYEFETTKKSGVYDAEVSWGYIADYLIANGGTIRRWIPVTERLPETDTEVLVCDIHAEFIEVYKFVKDDFDEYYWRSDWGENSLRFNDVTHWMPLPEPPKEECS